MTQQKNTTDWIKPIFCIDEESDGQWRIYQRGSAISRGTFSNRDDAVRHIEETMNIEKERYQVNPSPTFPRTFGKFVEIIRAQESAC